MIELSQPAQCLFCPQRRKIALLLKLVMAVSAAIITAMILFQPGSSKTGPSRVAPSFQGNASGTAVRVVAEARTVERPSDAVLNRSAEIRAQVHEGFIEVQSRLRPLLSEQPASFAEAQKILDERHREVLKTKVLALGDGVFSDSGAAEAERKLVLEMLDKEISVLAEQKKLLSELKGRN